MAISTVLLAAGITGIQLFYVRFLKKFFKKILIFN